MPEMNVVEVLVTGRIQPVTRGQVVTGMVFGLVPAWRAAQVASIDALRSE